MRFPAPFVDEGWNASRSWGMLTHGPGVRHARCGVYNQYPGFSRFFPWLGTALHVPLLALFGPSLFAMRLTSLLFGLALLLLVYFIAVRLYNPRAGLLSVLLVSVSLPFIFSAHIARHDIMVAVMGLGAVALYLCDERKPFPVMSLLAGLLVGLTLDVHLNGLVYIPALGALFLLGGPGLSVRAIAGNRRLWGYVAGVAVGVLFFAVMHLLPNPQDFIYLYKLGNGASHTPPLLTAGPVAWVQSIADVFLQFGLPLALLIALASVSLAYRRSPSDKILLVLFAVLVVAFALVVRNKSIQYAILVSPVAGLLIAAYIDMLLGAGWRTSRTVFVQIALAAGLVIASVAMIIPALTPGPTQEYQASLTLVRNAVPQGASVIGSQTYWFALPNQPYYSWEQLVFYRRINAGATIADAFRYMHPDYFVRDGWTDIFVTDDPAALSESNDTTVLPKSELESFLNSHAQLVASQNTDTFGSVRVYKIDWGSLGTYSGAVTS